MIALDIRTLIFTNMIIYIVCLAVMAVLWRQSRKRFAGMFFWVLDFALQTAAFILIILRGAIPDWMSVVLSNTMVMAGMLSGYMGLERFVEKNSPQIHNYILLIIFVSIHAHFTLIQPNLAARTLNISVGLLFISFQCAWLMLYRVRPDMRRLTRGVGMIFSAFCLVNMIRIAEIFVGTGSRADFFQASTFNALIFVSFKMLLILMTYSLVLMVNKRLFMDIKTQEARIQKLNESLEQKVRERTALWMAANRELDEYSYSISHDLRAPLRSIDGFSQILVEDYRGKPLDDAGVDYLGRIRKATQHLGRMIDDMLQLFRVTRTEFSYQSIDLTRMVQALLEAAKRNTPSCTVKVTVPEGMVVYANPYLLETALGNLIDNAWKFRSRETPLRIQFGVTEQNGETVYSLRDNGVGFDMAYVDKLFGAFQRLHSPEEFREQGSAWRLLNGSLTVTAAAFGRKGLSAKGQHSILP